MQVIVRLLKKALPFVVSAAVVIGQLLGMLVSQ